jgi:hypothetical protein
MLQGNAFFGVDPLDNKDWYEQWLPEAAAIFYGNGGPTGWAGETSWMKDMKHESKSVEDAWKSMEDHQVPQPIRLAMHILHGSSVMPAIVLWLK